MVNVLEVANDSGYGRRAICEASDTLERIVGCITSYVDGCDL